MDVKDAQREIRSVYMGGFAGQLVSSLVWFLSAAAAILIGSGLVLGLYGPQAFSLRGWLTAVVLLAFAFISRMVAMRKKN